MARVVISSNDLEATFNPAIGGRLTSLKFQDACQLVAPINDEYHDWLRWPKAGAFPLFPFHGRLSSGTFIWKGRPYHVATNPNAQDHALHGPAQRRQWRVTSRETNSVEIQLEYLPDEDWPFDFRASQRFTINGEHLSVELSLENSGSHPMPGGIGWHPYFAGGIECDAFCDADTRWVSVHSPKELAVVPRSDVELPLAKAPFTEHFSNWSRASIDMPEVRLEISASDSLNMLVVHRTCDYTCFEPVSHVAGVYGFQEELYEKAGLKTLAPGEVLSGRIKISVTRV